MNKIDKQPISLDTIRYDLRSSLKNHLWPFGILLLSSPIVLLMSVSIYFDLDNGIARLLWTTFPATFVGLTVFFGVRMVRAYLASRSELRIVKDTLLTSYIPGTGRRHGTYNDIYRLSFLHSGEYTISAVNYRWSPRLSMTDKDLFNCSQDGDSFYVVLCGKTPQIRMVYNCKLFELREKNVVEELKENALLTEVFTEKEIRQDLRTDRRRIGFLLLGFVITSLWCVACSLLSFLMDHQIHVLIMGFLYPVLWVRSLTYYVPRYIALSRLLRRKDLHIQRDRLVSAQNNPGGRLRMQRYRREHVLCCLHFATYGDYLFSRKHYKWSKHHVMSAPLLVHRSQPDDEFYVVLSKPAGGKILAVYNTKDFRLQHGMVTENTYF